MNWICIVTISLCLLLCASCSWLQTTQDDGRVPAAAGESNATDTAGAAGPALEYVPVLEGPIAHAGEKLQALVKDAAKLFTLRDKPPPTLNMLRRRGQDDLDRVHKVLQGEGYFEPETRIRVDGGQLAQAVLFVDPGPAYTVREVSIDWDGEAPDNPPQPADLQLQPGKPFAAVKAVDSQQTILQLLSEREHPFARVSPARAELDRHNHAVDVSFSVTPGPAVTFGPVSMQGLERTDPEYVAKLLPWQEGDPYDAALLETARQQLFATDIFSAVFMDPADAPEDGQVPIVLDLSERPSRTVRLGLRYDTDLGPGVQAQWEHRNLFGAGELLKARTKVTPKLQELGASFRKPFFYRKDQSFLAQIKTERTETDAFSGVSGSTVAKLERQLTPQLAVALGLGYRLAVIRETDDNDKSGHSLFFVPATLRWDTTNNGVNPTAGGRLNGFAAPFQEVGTGGDRFVKLRGAYSHYFPLTDNGTMVLALRGAAGSILTDDSESVPADELYYAGGGGSVRGRPYQKAGPLKNGDPVGGLSFLETSTELRVQFSKTIGAVAFVDAGRAYENWNMDFSRRLFIGWGFGARYFTDFGPIRVDVAFPWEKRPGVDNNFEIYMSLGQAF